MSGLSNACYRVSVEKPVVKPVAILYKKFECPIIDKTVEALIFKHMSDRGYGPKYIYQNSEYRIEEFIDARALSIWELRNPVFMTAYARAVYNFNFNKPAVDELKALRPLDVNNLAIDTAINEWGPKLKERLPYMRGKLLQDNGKPHPDKLQVIDLLERTFLFQGYRDYFSKLVPRDSEIVLSHNDT
jgi:hypothetical protein